MACAIRAGILRIFACQRVGSSGETLAEITEGVTEGITVSSVAETLIERKLSTAASQA